MRTVTAASAPDARAPRSQCTWPAACVQVEAVVSHYRWQGALQEAGEHRLVRADPDLDLRLAAKAQPARHVGIPLVPRQVGGAGEGAVERIHHTAAFVKTVPTGTEQTGVLDGSIICKQCACIGQLAVVIPHFKGIKQLFLHAVARPSLVAFTHL